MLTKKDYFAIGLILKSDTSKEVIIERMIDYFKQDNPLFDEQKFRNFIK